MLMEALGDTELSEHASEGLRHLVGYESVQAGGKSLTMLHALVKELLAYACNRDADGDDGGRGGSESNGDNGQRRRRIESLRLISLAIELHRLPAVMPLLSYAILRLAETCRCWFEAGHAAA